MSEGIVVDDREHAPQLIETLDREYNVDIQTRRLTYGDYIVGSDTIVERKTVTDFCRSIVTGRLYRQAFSLVEYTDTSLLLIEGPSFKPNYTGVSVEAVKGALITLAQTFRLPVLRTRHQDESAWYLNQIMVQRQRVGHNRGVLQGYYSKRLAARKRYLLQSFPGVGAKLAERLLEYFGTVENVVQASTEDLYNVSGLGAKKAEEIKRVVREEPSLYETRT